MTKKKFVKPEIQLLSIKSCSVIAESGGTGGTGEDTGGRSVQGRNTFDDNDL